MKIKSLDLENVCGYRKAKFDFTDKSGNINNISLLYGPNGCGKSTLLDISNIVAAPRRFQGRDVSMLFRKMIHHADYDPTYQELHQFENIMKINAVLEEDGKEYKVNLEVDPRKVEGVQKGEIPFTDIGVVLNELPEDKNYYAFYSNADNPSNMSRFQINAKAKDIFLDIATAVYGYECVLEKEVEEYDSQVGDYVTFFTDFIIRKEDEGEDIRVHFKRMSAGEKKIATLLAEMCSPAQKDMFDIYLIDNVELHIYFERHTLMIDKLLEHFPDKQIIATSHSPILVGLKGVIEPYMPKESLFDVVATKRAGVSQLM